MLTIGAALNGEGGQIALLGASSTAQAMFIDSYQDTFRVLKGTNVGVSSATMLQINSNGSWNTQSGATLTAGGTWTNVSSRAMKENFTNVDPQEVLNKLDGLALQRWNYKTENASTTHIGPIAEDFYAAFGTGNASTSISTIDPAGIALVGIKALNANLKNLSGLVFNTATNTATTTSISTSTIAMLVSDKSLSLENRLANVADAIDTLGSTTAATSTVATSTDANGNATSTVQLTFLGRVLANVAHWLADAGNGITNVFAKQATVETLCVGKGSDVTCLSKDQIDAILKKGSVTASTPAVSVVNSTPSSTSTTSPENIVLPESTTTPVSVDTSSTSTSNSMNTNTNTDTSVNNAAAPSTADQVPTQPAATTDTGLQSPAIPAADATPAPSTN